jgi:hypothetical protein
MRCSNCGFPLSPARTVCPRCGTAYGATTQPEPMPSSPVNNSNEYQNNIQYSSNILSGTPGMEGAAPQWGAPIATPVWNPLDGQQAYIPGAGEPLLDIEQIPFPDSDYARQTSPSTDGPEPAWQPGPVWQPEPTATPGRLIAPSSGSMPTPLQRPFVLRGVSSQPVQAIPRNRHSTRLGLTVASACIATGALLLIFVSIMARSLPLQNGAISENSGSQQTPVTRTQTPYPTNTPAIAATPTEMLPGQSYIDNGRMASSVIEDTGQVVQYATEFPVNQKVYVTFTVHAGMKPGAVCLSWYVNNAYDNHYEFAVNPNASYDAFSYVWFHKTGPAYVEIAWADTIDCTNKQLAQRVDFTVTG